MRLANRFVNTIHFQDIAEQRQDEKEMQEKAYNIIKRANAPPLHQRFKIPTKSHALQNVHHKTKVKAKRVELTLEQRIEREKEKAMDVLKQHEERQTAAR